MDNFNDWIIRELPLRPFVATDGLAGQIPIRSTNPAAIRELVWVDSSTLATTGADGKSAYQIAVINGFNGTELQWLASLKGLDGANSSNVLQAPQVSIPPNTTGVIDTIDLTQYPQIVWDVSLQTATKSRRLTVSSLYNRITSKVSYTTYGILGDQFSTAVSFSFDGNSNMLNALITNNHTEVILVDSLRCPLRVL